MMVKERPILTVLIYSRCTVKETAEARSVWQLLFARGNCGVRHRQHGILWPRVWSVFRAKRRPRVPKHSNCNYAGYKNDSDNRADSIYISEQEGDIHGQAPDHIQIRTDAFDSHKSL